MSSKLEATKIKTHSNLFRTKTERHSTTKFSFVMRLAETDSASVSAVRRAMDDSTHEMKVTKSVGLGSNDLTQASDSCIAVIVVNGDTTDTCVDGSGSPGKIETDACGGDDHGVLQIESSATGLESPD